MDGAEQLTVLADATRRGIFEHLLQRGPQAVGEVAAAFPVSRPAVSQHLKALVDAGLVNSDAAGSRRIYAVDPAGLSALHRWVDARWQHVLDNFAAAARREGAVMSKVTATIPPVRKTCTVPLDPAAAFALFTTRIAEWWPGSHSISGAAEGIADLRFEGRVGGRVVEVTTDGQEYSWADVVAWNPPTRFVLSWHPNVDPQAASRLEVTFQPADGGGTEVLLEHGAWEEFGDRGPELRENYNTGWDAVLARYREGAMTPM
ncbi:metalloregulator ArsR/SmtB family transcription factor [Actinomycetes bacterium KLBMP 9797]